MKAFGISIMAVTAACLLAGSTVSAKATSPAQSYKTASPAASRTQAKPADDGTLTDRIENKLKADASLKKFDIDVSVKDGVATLTGKVRTEAEKLRAGRDARMAGITRVDNQITLDKDAGKQEGTEIVTKRLEKEFGVTASQVESLRDKKLGFGEITIAFSLAQKMPGGITDANINKILTMRQSRPVEGWGEIAKKLGVKLGPVLSEVKKVERASHEELEKTGKNEHEKNGKDREHREAVKAERHDGPGRR